MIDERLERLLALKAGAEKIAAPDTAFGKMAREALINSTSLSPQGVNYALTHCLEHSVARSTLSGLVKQQPLCSRSHVLLSANVFVAAFRAILLGLVVSPGTLVRNSRRSPTMTRLLHEASGEAFEIVSELSPRAGDHFFAYGSDETLQSLRNTLTPGVLFHGHGHGMGAAVIKESPEAHAPDLIRAIDGLAQDITAFDQRGCLSPRVLIVEGSRAFAETICNQLVEALERWEELVPRGALEEAESADALRHESTMAYVGSCVGAGMGLVFLDPVAGRVLIPPVGRYLHVTVTSDALPLLKKLGPHLTSVGVFNSERLPGRLREAIGERRYVDLGQMQRPVLDGPVDLRHGWRAETL